MMKAVTTALITAAAFGAASAAQTPSRIHIETRSLSDNRQLISVSALGEHVDLDSATVVAMSEIAAHAACDNDYTLEQSIPLTVERQVTFESEDPETIPAEAARLLAEIEADPTPLSPMLIVRCTEQS